MISCEFYEISKNTFSYKTPLVAASGSKKVQLTYVAIQISSYIYAN